MATRPATPTQAKNRMAYDKCRKDAKERYNTRDAEIKANALSRAFGIEPNGIRGVTTTMGALDGMRGTFSWGKLGRGAGRGFLLGFVINADYWLVKGIGQQRTNEKYYHDANLECQKIPH